MAVLHEVFYCIGVWYFIGLCVASLAAVVNSTRAGLLYYFFAPVWPVLLVAWIFG